LTPVSRLRDAQRRNRLSLYASAGEGRSEKIMLKQQAKAKYRINRKSFRFSAGRYFKSALAL
jgi:hypothetical protein